MTPIMNYLGQGDLPEDKREAKRIRRQASFYTLQNSELFRRSFSAPLLKCLDEEQTTFVLAELHRGICRVHSGARMYIHI